MVFNFILFRLNNHNSRWCFPVVIRAYRKLKFGLLSLNLTENKILYWSSKLILKWLYNWNGITLNSLSKIVLYAIFILVQCLIILFIKQNANDLTIFPSGLQHTNIIYIVTYFYETLISTSVWNKIPVGSEINQ